MGGPFLFGRDESVLFKKSIGFVLDVGGDGRQGVRVLTPVVGAENEFPRGHGDSHIALGATGITTVLSG